MNKFLILVTSLLIVGCNTVKKEPTPTIVNEFMDYILDHDVNKVKEMLKEYRSLEKYHGNFETGKYKPLSIASWEGHKEIMQLLIDEGAEVNSIDESGYFPLFLSMYSDDASVVDLLLENGADINLKNTDGMTALHHASYIGHIDMVKYLIENGAIQSYMNDGCDSVTEAVDGGNLEVLKLLFEKGYNFNYFDINGVSPLASAVFGKGNEEIIRFFIEIKTDLDTKDKNSFTVLNYDMYHNNGLYLELLLEGGADPNINPDNNFSLLHAAVTRKLYKKVELLLEYDADPNLRDEKGKTPLDYAKELSEDETSKKIVSLLEEAMAY